MWERFAIVIAGALIALAILLTDRWQITASSGAVIRLDRWTGKVVICNTAVAADPVKGTELNCETQ